MSPTAPEPLGQRVGSSLTALPGPEQVFCEYSAELRLMGAQRGEGQPSLWGTFPLLLSLEITKVLHARNTEFL